MTIDIPEIVRNKARAAGRLDWVDGLSDLVDELCDEWQLTVGRSYDGGTEAFVCDVTRADGSAAVLKILVPHDRAGADSEALVLRLAAGDGCAELYEHLARHLAMLLERLGPSVYDLRLPIDRRHQILCDTAMRLWRPIPGVDLTTGAEKATWLAEAIVRRWEALDRPCSARVIDQAVSCAERRRSAHDDERAVLVHGDVHQWNVLRSGPSEFKLVDPDGLLAEPEYDLGVIMREDPLELMHGSPDDRVNWLAARSGLDATPIREWGIVERVSTGLLCVEVGLQPVGRQMLDAAEFVAAA